MMKINQLIQTYIILALVWDSMCTTKFLTYQDARKAVVEAEEKLMTGGTMLLSPREIIVNERLMEVKNEEIRNGEENISTFPPANHFFKMKHLIDKSPVYRFIHRMPKGALLHGHTTAMVSSEWFIKNVTYRPNIIKCINNKGITLFTFRESPEHECDSYVRISDERSRARDKDEYDKELEKAMNLYTPTPETDYPDINVVWTKFQNMFNSIGDAIQYRPVYRDFHYQLLDELYQDGVIYVEMRTSFHPLYDDERTSDSLIETIEELRKVVEDYKATHPRFVGGKVIFSTQRDVKPKRIEERINLYREFSTKYPNFIIGFDLVGQEDLGQPLINFLDELKRLPQGGRFFFHAGETNWYGTVDMNLLDAILLNTTRIGHGYALMKHPVLWNAVKNKGIAIEVSPLSNQVLHLLWDMRNHPAAFFLSENIPFVIANDDPGFWDAKGLSYDFYYAFMAFAPVDAGLKVLKQFAWNSIKYSSLTQSEKMKAAATFQEMWDAFLFDVISGSVIS